MKKVLYVGLDVDDKNFHIGAIDPETGEVLETSCKATTGSLLKQLTKIHSEAEIRLCYEATYIGFSLHRFLKKNGIFAEVIAPSMIPEFASNRVKTDRLDATKLARYYSKGLLTTVHIPSEEDEQDRDLIRNRSFLVEQRASLRRHILSLCRRSAIDFKSSGSKCKSHWTTVHMDWLKIQVNGLKGSLKICFEINLNQLQLMDQSIEAFDEAIELLAETEKYKGKKDALNCFRGISTLTAMTFITEIGDAKRFKHPRQLTSYAGLDVIEYSSGGKEKKFGITKMGNKRIRTAAVESCQRTSGGFVLSRRLKAHRQSQNPKMIAIADKCIARLRKKSARMELAGKPMNKVKVACAREFLSFVWEALVEVA